MKIINLSEQEVARHFRGSKSWLLIGNPIFKKLKCKKDYQPNPNLDEKIFAKGTEYACWICDIKNLRTGEFLHYIAQPEVAPLAKGALKGVVVPTDIFGKQSYKQEKVLVDIPDLGKYRLILGYDGYFRLIPEWHLWRQDVETFIKNKDKASHLDVQDYKIYPRIVGHTMRKAFVAYEINRRISDKLVLCSYFNTITGEEEKNNFDILISLVGKPKLSVIHGVTAKFDYTDKRIIMGFVGDKRRGVTFVW